MLSLNLPSPIQELNAPFLEEKEVRLFVKREDLIHPIVSGNKWRKLKYNLAKAKEQGHTTLLSFGGAYSNHIHALAWAAQEMGFRSIGIIRGEELGADNDTLSFARDCGMELYFVTREEYKRKTETTWIQALEQKLGRFYLVPEGGSNREGMIGCQEILPEIKMPYDAVCVACGTGTTMAGLVTSLPENKRAIGFPVLKGGDFLYDEINSLLTSVGHISSGNWELQTNYHFGGYAKWNDELRSFMSDFQNQHGIPLDQVYTAKMMYGLFDLIRKDFFEKGTSIVALHTGGLQGGLKF